MKKVLFVASVTGHILAFHLPYLEGFKKCGYVVEVVSNGEKEVPFCDARHQVCFARNPINKRNISAYRELKEIIKNGNYDIIHCHTPVAAMMTRLAARKVRKKGTKVVYTAHGFHFYKGASIKNWLIFFPIEWICSFFTDVLITINKEDFAFAKKYMNAKQIEYVPGVGFDKDKYPISETSREEKRAELGILENAVALVSVGELNQNKNHQVIIKAMAELKRDDLHYYIAGEGNQHEYLRELAKKLGLEDRVHLLGFRNDVMEILKASDTFCFPSFREGVPVSVMEAMWSKLPVVCSDIRGNQDLIDHEKGGYLFDPASVDSVVVALEKVLRSESIEEINQYNIKKLTTFEIENVKGKMFKIYGDLGADLK